MAPLSTSTGPIYIEKPKMRKKTKTIGPWELLRMSFVLVVLACALSCGSVDHDVSAEDRLIEFLADDAAKPLLLHDHQELLAFLKDFPREQYNLCPTNNGFSFFVEKGGPLDGIKQIVSAGQVWEEAFIKLMAEHIKPGSAVVDAGAYIGTHSMAMARLAGRRGRVYAFEPQKKVFRELVFNLIENDIHNVTPLRFALGEADRIIEMDKPVNGLEAVVRVGKGGDQVELRTLDSFNLRRVSFLKIDVEGYENNVLEGARRTIARNSRPPILIEIAGATHYFAGSPEARTRVEKTLHTLEACGYAVTPLPYRDFLALPAPDYPLGSTLSFADSGNAHGFRSGWWFPAEAWGCWTRGYAADLVLPLLRPPKKDLLLVVLVKAFIDEKNPQQEVEVVVNDRPLARWIIRDGETQQKKAVIPASLWRGTGGKPILRLAFQTKNPRSPAESKWSADKRLLGLGVVKLTVREL
jgi:FkbM family methyltransferase